MFRGNANPKSSDEMRKEVLKRYGKIGVPVGTEPVPIKKEFQQTARLIRTNQHGQRDIVVEGTVGTIHQVTIFVDTGSQVSIISEQWYNSHKKVLGPIGPMPSYNLLVADGAKAQVKGTVQLEVTFADPDRDAHYTRRVEFVVMSGLSEPVLAGMNLLKLFFKVIDLDSGMVKYRNELQPDHDEHLYNTISEGEIRVGTGIRVPARSARRIKVSYPSNFIRLMSKHDLPILREPVSTYDHRGTLLDIDFPNCVDQQTEGGTAPGSNLHSMLIINKSDYCIDLRSGQVIGKAILLPERGTVAAPNVIASSHRTPLISTRTHMTTIEYDQNLLKFNTPSIQLDDLYEGDYLFASDEHESAIPSITAAYSRRRPTATVNFIRTLSSSPIPAPSVTERTPAEEM